MFVDLIDAFRGFLTVDPALITVDDTLTQPVKALPDRLYVWPIRNTQQPVSDDPQGRVPDPMLRVAVLLTRGSRGETRTIARDRKISVELDNMLEALIASIYANRRAALWWDAYHESIAFDAVRNDTARGHGVNVVLRLNEPIGG